MFLTDLFLIILFVSISYSKAEPTIRSVQFDADPVSASELGGSDELDDAVLGAAAGLQHCDGDPDLDPRRDGRLSQAVQIGARSKRTDAHCIFTVCKTNAYTFHKG